LGAAGVGPWWGKDVGAVALIVVEILGHMGYGWCQIRKIGRFEAVLAVYP